LKLIVTVIDGMGDIPEEELGGKTPLELAETPNMNLLSREGSTGLMYAVRKGMAPESDVAVISILGYDPFKYHTGRGPLEALGSGIRIEEGNLALRCNFATLGPDNQILDRRAGREITPEEASQLSQAVNEQVRLEGYPANFELKGTIEYRCVLVIRSKAAPFSSEISNTDPHYARVQSLGVAVSSASSTLQECIPLESGEAARNAALVVNEFTRKSHKVLDQHPVNLERVRKGKPKANLILTRDAGSTLPKLPSMDGKFHARFACLADMPVERGIATVAGMSLIDLPPPSGDIAGDYRIRAETVLEKIESYDCIYVHIKGPDIPSHDGDAHRKVRNIARIDRSFLGNLVPKIDLDRYLICVTADHATSWKQKEHTDDPVPLVVAGRGVPRDNMEKFCERTCRTGSLGVLSRGTQLMPMLMRYFSQSR
jgi:2,3-bisphosphoglycerate-independent phosphoglycerate mutase